MKKNLLVIGTILAVWAMAFAGCQNGAQEVEGDVGNYRVLHGPSVDADKIVVTKGTGGASNSLIVNFTAADNAKKYYVFISLDKKMLLNRWEPDNAGFALKDDGTIIGTVPDYTKYSTEIGLDPSDTQAYYVGVQAEDALDNRGSIKWTKDTYTK